MKEFYRKNSSSILIIMAITGLWMLFYALQPDKTDDYIKEPQVGDVYLLTNDTIYAPMRLDSVGGGQFYMRNYSAIFAERIPKQSQILNDEFDTNFFAIYDSIEIKRLRKVNQIIKVYR